MLAAAVILPMVALGLNVQSAGASGLTPALKPPTILTTGQIRYCSDISSPPIEFLNSKQRPIGSDIQIGTAIAKALHLKAVWEQTAFSGIIPALQAHHCDAILSQLYIKASRKTVVDFVPYMYSSESVTVPSANPGNITGFDTSLCGQTVSTVTGTTAQTELATLSSTCTSEGKSPVQAVLFTSDVQALQNMLTGRSTAYTTTSETGAYYMRADHNQFKFVGKPFGRILTGIAINKKSPKLLAALKHAFALVRKSGKYNKIMTKWGISRDEL
ncbi:MAG TPA: ABC transporter substrate-binding protein [Acidimicrobiales bacterium]|nr:ABC transporter substrate-binding protein [Acidimicrobiales bacterium]